MSTTVDLTRKREIIFGNDSIVIRKYFSGLKGGRSLDVTGFEDSEYLSAGHVIISNGETFKPLAVSDGAYGELESGYSYVGILYRSILVKQPMAAIMTNGEVTTGALPYPLPDDFKEAMPFIREYSDNDTPID